MATMHSIRAWIHGHQHVLQQLGTVSLILLVITVIALPIVVINLPEDYFTKERRQTITRIQKHQLLWSAFGFLKNLFGLSLILVGFLLLVLPGQGIVTILIGITLTNFPGKYNLERRIVCHAAVGRTLNKIRELASRPPLQMPPCAREKA